MSTEKQNGKDHTGRPDYIDGVDGINGRPVTKDERSYRDGYVEGQSKVKGTQYERERAAETNGLASGVIIGSVLAFSVGLGFAVWAYANRDTPIEQPSSTSPLTAPASPKASAVPTAPAKQTTIIERTIEKPAPPPVVIEVPKAAPSPASVAPSPATPDRPPSGSDRTTPTAPSNEAPAPTKQAPASPSANPTTPDSMSSPNSQGGGQ
jgi:hypothetical protein